MHATEYDLTATEAFADLLDGLKEDRLSSFGLYQPPQFSLRIAVQRSHFILSPSVSDNSGTTQLAPLPSAAEAEARLSRIFDGDRKGGHTATLPVTIIKIARSTKPKVLEHLKTKMGISHESLFPDLDGFARSRGLTGTPLTTPDEKTLASQGGVNGGLGLGKMGVTPMGR